ncbi:MAG: oligosaccharide flippase family protein, partial [Meiothermus sp.]|nr:oligosaccharide flippase family protein [Meiothermus sp.]
MSEPIEVGQVARKLVRSAFALGVRQLFVQGINILGGVLLARMLPPVEFGLYSVSMFFMALLGTLGGTGLAGGLIRQQNPPSNLDYKSLFTIQQAVVLCLAALLWLAAPAIAEAYRLKPEGAWLFRLLAISLVLTTFMVIPQVQLERRLDFDRLALVEVAQALAFNAVAILFAWSGYGSLSFGFALLSRALVGAISINLLNPWKLGWFWDWHLARKHLGFGLYLQGGQVISLIKDSITPIFVGFYLGTEAVGYITWAQMLASYPVWALMILQRLYMPAFARLQHERGALVRFAERVLFVTNALVAPVTVLTVVLVEPITRLIFGEKWLLALPLFYLLVLANMPMASSTPLQGLL